MFYPTFYPTQLTSTTPLMLINKIIGHGLETCHNPIFSFLTFRTLPENPVITPTSSVQVVRPSAANRYLQTVTVEAIPTTPAPGA